MKEDFLKKAVLEKQKAVKEAKRAYPEDELRLKLEEPYIYRPFASAISQKGGSLNIIAEIKRISPSQGLLKEDFDPVRISRLYENAGAKAISVLTEEDFFGGKLSHLSQARKIVSIPILRKDFIIDKYQLYESKFFGADAVLLIAELLKAGKLSEFLSLAKRLELDCLVEAGSPEDINYALDQGAEIIGVNSRNLHTLEVDNKILCKLRKYIPKDIILVAESGIGTHREYSACQKLEVNALLIGSALMKSADIKKKFRDIVEGSKRIKKSPKVNSGGLKRAREIPALL